MTKRNMLFLSLVLCSLAVVFAWAALVPASMSLAAFGGTLAALAMASGGTLLAVNALRAPRTIAQVLHDVEQAGVRR